MRLDDLLVALAFILATVLATMAVFVALTS